MRKKSGKIKLQRETLRNLGETGQRMAAGGIATRRCTDTEECTQSPCGGATHYLCTTVNTCYTCYTCVLANCV